MIKLNKQTSNKEIYRIFNLILKKIITWFSFFLIWLVFLFFFLNKNVK